MQTAYDTGSTFIVFTVAGTAYAVPSSAVRHMEMLGDITRVPNAAPYVDGVVFSRGEVVPVLNLRARFGFDRVPFDLRTRLVVAQVGQRTAGLLVDSAREFVSIPAASIQPPSDALTGMSGRYIRGIASVGERLVLVLDLEQVLEAEPTLAA